ncbi:MAG: hypothetical protein HY012_01580 [Acidobacteria bacterium]|nr:hypothetical protein [Acidobacteriota bacterium]
MQISSARKFTRQLLWLLSASLIGAAFLVAAQSGEKAKPEKPKKLRETYSMTAFPQRGALGAQTVLLTVVVDAYSTDAEVLDLVETLKAKDGADQMLKKLNKMNKGRISPVSRLGTNLAVVRTHATENGRVIRMLTDRPISFFEAYNSTRSRDYPFSIIELRLDKDGKGEGTLLVATKIKFNKENMLEIENYGRDPIRLVNVRREK